MKKIEMEDIKAKIKTQFINYLAILNHENRLLIFGPICPKPFEDVQINLLEKKIKEYGKKRNSIKNN